MSNQLLIFKGGGGGVSGSSAPQTVVLGTFRALADGIGYSTGDIVVLRQTGTDPAVWYNATLGVAMGTPPSADLGSVTAVSSVSVSASALPTGAATAAKQLPDNHQVEVSNVVTVVSGVTPVTVDGTVTADTGLLQGLTNTELRATAVPVSLASVPSHNVTNTGTFAVQATLQANTGVDVGDVTINNGSLGNAVNIQDGGNTITVDGTIAATQSGTWTVDVGALPATAATAALQTSGNSSLTSIDGKFPAQQSGSVPVILPASQITTLTPPAAITGFATSAKQPQFGSPGSSSLDVVSVQGVSGGTALDVKLATSDVTAITDITTAVEDVKASVDLINAKLVSGTDIGDVTINNGVGSAAVNIQDGGNTITVDGTVNIGGAVAADIADIDAKIPANLTVTSTRLLVDGSGVTQPISGTVTANTGLTQPLTDAQLRASAPEFQLTAGQLATLTPPAAITGFATQTTLAAILTALNGNVNFNETIWTDDTGAYFARRVSQDLDTNTITVAYTLPDGSAYTVGANPRPLAAVDREIRNTLYNAVTAGTGYSIGDDIVRSDIIDVNSASVIVTLWYNATTKANIAAPTPAHIAYISTDDYARKDLQENLNEAIGSIFDSAATTDNGNFSLISFVKRWLEQFAILLGRTPALGQTTAALSTPVVIASNQSLTGTGLALESGGVLGDIDAKIPANLTVTSTRLLVDNSGVTQPISASSLPLPTGAATAAKQPALGVAGTPSTDVLTVQGTASMTALRVDGSAVTQPVSASSLPLPTGAATSALQTTGNSALASIDGKTPSLGQALSSGSVPVVLTAAQLSTLTPFSTVSIGSTLPAFASTPTFNVGTIAGIATETTLSALNTKVPANLTVTATRLLVDGSGVTQPVSGTITANIGTTNGLALDATLTGGSQKAIARGGAKGSTTAADLTGTASGVNHQALDVIIYDTSGNAITSFGGGTEYTTGDAQATPAGNVSLGWDGANVRALATDITGKLNLNNISGTISLPTGASTATLQTSILTAVGDVETSIDLINAKLVSGTDIGDVTINNANGVNAVNIQDGGNTITVDGTVEVGGAVASDISSIDAKIPATVSGGLPVSQAGAPWSVTSTPPVSSSVRLPLLTNVPVQIGTGAKTIRGLIIRNPGSGANGDSHFKMWNSSAAPTVGTTPVTITPLIIVRGTTLVDLNLNINFSTGLWVAVTRLAADGNSQAPTTEFDVTVFT